MIDPNGAGRRLRLARYEPHDDLHDLIEHFWIVEWKIEPGLIEEQRVLPYPNANLVFESGQSALFGPVRGAFIKRLSGSGRAVGVRLRIGSVRTYTDVPMARLVDTSVSPEALVGDLVDAEEVILSAGDDHAMIETVETLLRPRLRKLDATATWVGEMVRMIAADPRLLTVEHLAQRSGRTVRTLQRAFLAYVGLGPKSILRRFRLQEAAYRLAGREPLELVTLAYELGYCDQAHLARDFVRHIGQAPASYRRSQT